MGRLSCSGQILVSTGDSTAVLISIKDTKEINLTYNHLDRETELNASLHNSISAYQTLNKSKDKQINNQAQQLSLKDTIIHDQEKELQGQTMELSGQDRKIKWLKIQRGILIGIGLLLTGKLYL